MDELLLEIFDELKIELGIEDVNELAILKLKIKNAIREVRSAVGYKDIHSEEFILNELADKYYGNIRKLAIYDFCTIGAEGQVSHSENNTQRTWISRSECFNGIIRYAN